MPAAEAFRVGVVLLAVFALVGCEPSLPSVPVLKPENIVIAVDKNGNFYWNGEQVSCAELSARFAAAAPKPADAPEIDACGHLEEQKRLEEQKKN